MKILTPWLRSYLPVLSVDDHQLAEDLTLRGIAVEGVFELDDPSGDSDGALFDTDITTNRVDAMNHYGIAREAAAIYNLPLHPLDATLPASVEAAPFPVRIDAPTLCGRFTAQVIRDVHIAPSAGRLRDYFLHLNQKLISNAVDITNFVLLATGQPTHAYDLDKIEGGIVVRQAHPGEQIKLLDGSTRTLVADDLVVADERKALGLAGVMGGYDSMITAETKNILVEAAWFAPAAVRASSRRHLLHTDASHRFERGADFAFAPTANALVAKHILAACGGHLAGAVVDLVIPGHEAETAARPAIQLSVAHVQRLLGTTLDPAGISAELIAQYLTALGCQLTPVSDDLYQVQLPSWRLDLAREIDLIEEVARVYGYNRFANTLPTPGTVVAHPTAHAEAAVRARLLALGYSEALSSTFTSASETSLPAVALENPLNEEAANLRPSLVPGMLAMLAGNLTRDVVNARLFEMGAIFSGNAKAVHEALSLSLGLMGEVAAAPPINLAADAPFYELKGALESICGLFETPTPAIAPATSPLYEAGRAATFSLAAKPHAPGPAPETWAPIATFGQFSTAEAARRKIRQPLYLAELDLATLLTYPLRRPIARELSRFQAVDRDFSFIFPDAIVYAQIAAAIHALAIPELIRLHPVELWRNQQKSPGVYATLVRATFQSPTRTLTDEDLTTWWAAIISALQALGGTIRDH